MTKKGMIIFILWIIFCIGLIAFMIVHTAIEQSQELNINNLLLEANYLISKGGMNL